MDEAPITVLLVDDEADFASALATRLARRGFETVWVSSGAEALATLEQRPFDVVLLDLRMPGMSGMETLHEIRRRTPAVQVIVLTGHGGVETGIQGMQSGAADYLRKPVPIDTLCVAIQEAAERSRGANQ